jgi:oxaloacetate decarboxylase alpha subunit/pyruvate carboxylase subunit B
MLNVKFGRWKNVAQSISDIALGKFGRTPGPVDPDFLKLVIEKTGMKPIEGRPADALSPRMPKLREELLAKGLPTNDEACVLHAMFPVEFAKLYQKPAPAAPAPAPVATPVAAPAAAPVVAAPVAVAPSGPSSDKVVAGSTMRLGLTINGKRTEVSVAEIE